MSKLGPRLSALGAEIRRPNFHPHTICALELQVVQPTKSNLPITTHSIKHGPQEESRARRAGECSARSPGPRGYAILAFLPDIDGQQTDLLQQASSSSA